MKPHGQVLVWEAVKVAKLPDPSVRPYQVLPVRPGPWDSAVYVEVNSPGAEPLQSKVTDIGTVEDLARRIEQMVTSVLEAAAHSRRESTTRRG